MSLTSLGGSVSSRDGLFDFHVWGYFTLVRKENSVDHVDVAVGGLDGGNDLGHLLLATQEEALAGVNGDANGDLFRLSIRMERQGRVGTSVSAGKLGVLRHVKFQNFSISLASELGKRSIRWCEKDPRAWSIKHSVKSIGFECGS